jgi:alpha-1,3-rhamnosyltransferase
MNSNPLVSIVVITYNSSKYVLETLESAKAQTYQNIELIVTDDGSTDRTIEICEKWLAENKDRFVRTELITIEKNTGIPANCNRGVKASQGEWVKLIAGDDVLVYDLLEKYIAYTLTNSETKFIHSNVERLIKNKPNELENKNKYYFNQPNTTSQEQFEILLRINPIYAATTFIHKDIFINHGYFDEKFKLWEDRPMWLKLTKNGVKLDFLNITSVRYRVSLDSVQSKRIKTNIHSEFQIIRDGYMMSFNEYLPFLERTIKKYDYNRIYFLNKMGLNKIAVIPRFINFLTGILVRNYIEKINEKYKYLDKA